MTTGDAGAPVLREEQARKLDDICAEASRLADHARMAAACFRNHEVPRAAAHAMALAGHLTNIQRIFDDIASVHASRAQVAP